MFESNVIGTLQVTQALLPALVASGAGTIVNVGSIAGRVAYEGGSGYVAAKHAVAALTETLRLELVDQPVRVEEIAPGMVRTEEFALTRFGGDQERADAVYAGVSEPLVAAGHRRRDRLDGRATRRTSTSTCSSSSRASRPPRTRCTASPEKPGQLAGCLRHSARESPRVGQLAGFSGGVGGSSVDHDAPVWGNSPLAFKGCGGQCFSSRRRPYRRAPLCRVRTSSTVSSMSSPVAPASRSAAGHADAGRAVGVGQGVLASSRPPERHPTTPEPAGPTR